MPREAMTNWQHTCGGAVSFPTGVVTWTWKRMWLTSPSHQQISLDAATFQRTSGSECNSTNAARQDRSSSGRQ
ncbi:unnamed protein product [Calypogeia fissa]